MDVDRCIQDAPVRALDARDVRGDPATEGSSRGRARYLQLLHGHLFEPRGDRARAGHPTGHEELAHPRHAIPRQVEAIPQRLEVGEGATMVDTFFKRLGIRVLSFSKQRIKFLGLLRLPARVGL